jgi:hypothetical protein
MKMLVKFANTSYTIAAGTAVSGKLQRPQSIKVASGRVWLTVEGWEADHWLKAGEAFALPAGRLIVLEADQDASRIEAAPEWTGQQVIPVEHVKSPRYNRYDANLDTGGLRYA